MCHQPLPHRTAVPELHSPSPDGVCEATSRRFRNRTGRVAFGVARQKHPGLVRGHQVGGPEPLGQRDLGSVKNRPGCQRDLVTAAHTLPPPLIHQLISSPICAARTDETSGQRQAARYASQASSVAKSLWNCRRFLGNGGLGTLQHYPLGYAESTR
jgi:hypothetical protein